MRITAAAGNGWFHSGMDFLLFCGSFHQPLPFCNCATKVLVPVNEIPLLLPIADVCQGVRAMLEWAGKKG